MREEDREVRGEGREVMGGRKIYHQLRQLPDAGLWSQMQCPEPHHHVPYGENENHYKLCSLLPSTLVLSHLRVAMGLPLQRVSHSLQVWSIEPVATKELS